MIDREKVIDYAYGIAMGACFDFLIGPLIWPGYGVFVVLVGWILVFITAIVESIWVNKAYRLKKYGETKKAGTPRLRTDPRWGEGV